MTGNSPDNTLCQPADSRLNAAELIDRCDVLFITLDALRYDVATRALAAGRTPHLAAVLPGGKWERRQSPGNFTYAAHHAFFAGFLPVPEAPGRHERLFAAAFPGSETTGATTCVFEAPTFVEGLASRGYHTACIGGVGFFNRRSPLGSVLPNLFHESHWQPEFGVTSACSTQLQAGCALDILRRQPTDQRLFLFVNVSAMHQPSHIFEPGATTDSPRTQEAALAYADRHLGPLFSAFARRGPTLCIVCADHGTALGEDGYTGHRINHPVVGTVPYAEFLLSSHQLADATPALTAETSLAGESS